MKTISMLEMRKNAAGVVAGLRRGERYLLTFRREPVGELCPVMKEPKDPKDDPVYRLAEQAEDLGNSLDAEEADRLLYRA